MTTSHCTCSVLHAPSVLNTPLSCSWTNPFALPFSPQYLPSSHASCYLLSAVHFTPGLPASTGLVLAPTCFALLQHVHSMPAPWPFSGRRSNAHASKSLTLFLLHVSPVSFPSSPSPTPMASISAVLDCRFTLSLSLCSFDSSALHISIIHHVNLMSQAWGRVWQ